MNSAINKLKTYGGTAVNKTANIVLSKTKKNKRLSKKAQAKLNEADALKKRRCSICKITYIGSIASHKLTKIHKENKFREMIEIKKPTL
jgi:hypothetical protein